MKKDPRNRAVNMALRESDLRKLEALRLARYPDPIHRPTVSTFAYELLLQALKDAGVPFER